MSRFAVLLLAAVAGVLIAVPGSSAQVPGEEDIINLKNGQEIVGKITAEDEKTITVLFRGGEIVLPKRKVASIVRGERVQVEKQAERRRVLTRFESRDEFYYVFYLGRCVGWRQQMIEPVAEAGRAAYHFWTRTVFTKDGGAVELDVKVSQYVDADGIPVSMLRVESGDDGSVLTEGAVDRGFLRMKRTESSGYSEAEVLFPSDAEWPLVLSRKLADATHYPDAGLTYKLFDDESRALRRVHAVRALRKEVVAGKQQFVTVWTMASGEDRREVWIDGHGGIVREELGHANLVALRALKDDVTAFARGERKGPSTPDLELEYESVPQGFKLARPTLSWSFEFPEPDGSLAITLINPTLQASVDVAFDAERNRGLLPETLAMDLVKRMGRNAGDQQLLYQKPQSIGGVDGVRFEATQERKGMSLRTMAAVAVVEGRAYSLLFAAPAHRYHEAEPHFEKILRSFEITDRAETSPAAEN